MTSREYRQKLDFGKVCEQYGFYKSDYGMEFIIFHGHNYIPVKLVGFTQDGKCSLETPHKTRVGKLRRLPFDREEVMRAIRSYHWDKEYEAKKPEEVCKWREMAMRDSKRLRDAGFEEDPTRDLNFYGQTMTGHIPDDYWRVRKTIVDGGYWI